MTLSMADANRSVFNRYLDLLADHRREGVKDPLANDSRLSLGNLHWMCTTGANTANMMPEDKAARWIGFVQGCLAMRGMINVDEERDFTRPLFHQVFMARTGKIPETLSQDGT